MKDHQDSEQCLPESNLKRKILTLEERVEVIRKLDRNESCQKIAKAIKCGKTQIQNIFKDRELILKEWESGRNSKAKYLKKALLSIRKNQRTIMGMVSWSSIEKHAHQWTTVTRKSTTVESLFLVLYFITDERPPGFRDRFLLGNKGGL
ncbi:Uncharacterised protein r2_g908 [Pycnogonum litorale]